MTNAENEIGAGFSQLIAAIDGELVELRKLGGEVFHDVSPRHDVIPPIRAT
jgi:hypothetical protein